MSTQQRVAIVGASVAGVAAADGLRSNGFTGAIELYDAQAHPPYDRPPLSKQFLAGETDERGIALKTEEEWEQLSVRRLLGTEVTSIDAASRSLTAGGLVRRFDGLVLTPGAAPRPIPFPVEPGCTVHLLRTLDDARSLRKAMVTGGSIGIIGAGFVGLEVASMARAMGLACTVIEAAPLPLAAALGPDMARMVLARHVQSGTRVLLGRSVVEVAAGRRAGVEVRLADGARVPCDVLVVGIGVRPAVDFLDGSGLELDDGVRTDAYGQTSAPRIYAAGDAASAWSALLGAHLRFEHWTTARSMGALVGANLAADLAARPRAGCTDVPYAWSDQVGWKIQTVGHRRRDDEVRVDHRDDASMSVSFLRGDQIVGGAALNRPKDVMRIRRLVAQSLHAADSSSSTTTPMALDEAEVVR